MAVYLEEHDSNGNLTRSYHDGETAIVCVQEQSRTRKSGVVHIAQVLVRVFLPTGYPDSVTRDYIDYQIYDSIQAFSSSISSLLGSRAVLMAVGVGDVTATSTSALFITVVKDTIGRLATILFAWQFGSMLEQECKKFRYAADLVNNAGIVCDCLSPYFTNKAIKISILCCSGVLKAICGVMANGSRAALTQHFTDAEKGSISDVAAKDASQETVISLLGMLTGSAVVPYINTDRQVWATLFLLMTVHLWTNYRAVRSVVMDTLNRQRANMVFAQIMDTMSPGMMESDLAMSVPTHSVPVPTHVAAHEHILERDGTLRWGSRGARMGAAVVGSFADVSAILPAGMTLRSLSHIFGDSGYVLWYYTSRIRGQKRKLVHVRIALIDNDDETRDIRAWTHALYLARHVRATHNGNSSADRDTIERTLRIVNSLFKGGVMDALRARGWHVARGKTMITNGSTPRVKYI